MSPMPCNMAPIVKSSVPFKLQVRPGLSDTGPFTLTLQVDGHDQSCKITVDDVPTNNPFDLTPAVTTPIEISNWGTHGSGAKLVVTITPGNGETDSVVA